MSALHNLLKYFENFQLFSCFLRFVIALALLIHSFSSHAYHASTCFEAKGNTIAIPANLGWTNTSEKLVCPKSDWRHGCCVQSPILKFNISDNCVNFTNFLVSVQGKRLCFFGDSLSQNTFKALLSQLSQFKKHFRHSEKSAKHFAIVDAYNFSIYFHEFYYLNIENETHTYTIDPGKYRMNSTTLESEIEYCDIAVINVGLHFGAVQSGYTVSFYTELLRYIKSVLEREMSHSPAKRHVYRLTFPQHFTPDSGFSHSGDYLLRRMPPSCEPSSLRHWSDLLAQNIFHDSKVKILDYYNVFKDAGLYHSAKHKDDCSHYCWNQFLWRPFWGMLTAIANDVY